MKIAIIETLDHFNSMKEEESTVMAKKVVLWAIGEIVGEDDVYLYLRFAKDYVITKDRIDPGTRTEDVQGIVKSTIISRQEYDLTKVEPTKSIINDNLQNYLNLDTR